MSPPGPRGCEESQEQARTQSQFHGVVHEVLVCKLKQHSFLPKVQNVALSGPRFAEIFQENLSLHTLFFCEIRNFIIR